MESQNLQQQLTEDMQNETIESLNQSDDGAVDNSPELPNSVDSHQIELNDAFEGQEVTEDASEGSVTLPGKRVQEICLVKGTWVPC
ncbi:MULTISPECIES: hypothetical protein [unclassified Anabaena]|uniref:hypothetical protein n=1 Tax=unclassified Anabaena TaxID=2619674 RepID=UPI0039C6C429